MTERDDAGAVGSLILCRTEDGKARVECRFEDETLWLAQAQMALMFDIALQSITLHLKAIFAEGEVEEEATCKDYLQVRTEGARQVSRAQRHYSLPAVSAVGCARGTQFRAASRRVGS